MREMKRCVMLYLLLHLQIFQGVGQHLRSFFPGETAKFAVDSVANTTYGWRVSERLDFKKGGETDKVTILTPKDRSVVLIRWEKAGTFFLLINGSDHNGCSNLKVFPVVVTGEHIPDATDDYLVTNWLEPAQIDLLKNDYDAGNDLDTSSLQILVKPGQGEITSMQLGTIRYRPFSSQPGTDRFYYRICDLCDQCDTAMVSVTLVAPPLFLPEGISPNGDGLNDLFVVRGLEAYPNSALTIFRRDGVILFEEKDYRNDWPGSAQNQVHSRLPTGTYYYWLRPGGTGRIIKGFFFLAE